MIHNFTWPLYPISPGFYKVVPREVEDNGCAFGGGGGYRTWTMVSVKIVNMVKMSWVKSGNQNRIRFILPMQKAAINILS